MREIQEKVFNNIQEYLTWNTEQYQYQTGIKVIGLHEIEDNKMIAEYIELY